MCVTFTDMAVLCGAKDGTQTCFYKYASIPVKRKYCHEFALRIVLYKMNQIANQYQKLIEPILSLTADFYIRLFFKVRKSPQGCASSSKKISHILQCKNCQNYSFYSIGEKKARIDNHKCDICDGPIGLFGPIWTFPIHDIEFAQTMLDNLPKYALGTAKRITGILTGIIKESQLQNIPLSFDISGVAGEIKIAQPTIQMIQ